MNIKQAEKETGISSQNIRYYEKMDLIHPKRNHLNGYRTYDETDIRKLKIIKMFRMVDLSIENIKKIFDEDITIQAALSQHKEVLEEKADRIQDAISFCKELSATTDTLDSLDVDSCLSELEQSKQDSGFFTNWINDYKKVIKSEHKRQFTFAPDGAVTNSREFTAALFEYADKNNVNLVLTKEGMYPEFTIDGIEYTAERYYASVSHVPMAMIKCKMKNAEDYQPDISPSRLRYMRILHIGTPVLIAIVLSAVFCFKGDFTWENIVLYLMMIVVAITIAIRNYYLYWNMQ